MSKEPAGQDVELWGPEEQEMELSGPNDGGWYTSQLNDWVPLCPQLKDSAVRLYWIMRALVIEKRGPVRKLTVLELCHLLPTKSGVPSSLARVRGLLSDLSAVGLISTPDGEPVRTSSRAKASGTALRIQIKDRPSAGRAYEGPRNAFDALDSIREAARQQAAAAVAKEAARDAARKAERAAQEALTSAGQISGPHLPGMDAGQISGPAGQKSGPWGQISDPHSGADLQDREPPFSLSAQSSRSRTSRPSVRTPEVDPRDGSSTEGRMDGGDVDEDQETRPGATGGGVPTAATAASANGKSAATGAGVGRGSPAAVAPVVVTPGVEVLRAIGAEFPRWELGPDALRDKGLLVTGMLESGFTAAEIRDAFARRMPPRPEDLTHTIGAVAGRRLSDLIAVGPRAGVRPIPAQPEGPGWDGYGRQEHRGRDDEPTPAPAKLADKQAAIEAAASGKGTLRFCPEDGETCPNVVATGEDKCPEHLGWPMCAVCGHRKRGARRMRPGATSCGHCATAAGPLSDAELAGLLAEAARRAQPTEAPF